MNHLRHIGIYSCDNLGVTLIGAGGIGAITAITLAKMGVAELRIFDPDTVEDINLPTQFHPHDYEGAHKVWSVSSSVNLFSDETYVEQFTLRVGQDTDPALLSNVVIISAVDSIAARKEIWEVVKRAGWEWYIDARMGAENYMRYAVQRDYQWYEDALAKQDDSLIEDLPCTSKATIYCGCVAAGMLGETVKRIVAADPVPKILSLALPTYTLTIVD